jgi:PKD repeat protein
MNTKDLLSQVLVESRITFVKRCVKPLVPVRLSLLAGLLLSISVITGNQAQAQNCDADFFGSQIGVSTEARFIDSNSRGNFNKWYYGNGQTDTGTSLILASQDYNSYGTYQVCHVVKDGSCRDSTCQQITLSCDTGASFNYSVTGQQVGFFNQSYSVDSIIWDFGDGSKGYGRSPSHTYNSGGSYSVTLKIIRNRSPRCVATTQRNINISCDTTTSFTSSRDSINYLDVRFLAGTRAADSFIWDFGDGSKGYGASTSHKYASTGNYTVTLKVVRNSSVGCVATT